MGFELWSFVINLHTFRFNIFSMHVRAFNAKHDWPIRNRQSETIECSCESELGNEPWVKLLWRGFIYILKVNKFEFPGEVSWGLTRSLKTLYIVMISYASLILNGTYWTQYSTLNSIYQIPIYLKRKLHLRK